MIITCMLIFCLSLVLIPAINAKSTSSISVDYNVSGDSNLNDVRTPQLNKETIGIVIMIILVIIIIWIIKHKRAMKKLSNSGKKSKKKKSKKRKKRKK